MSAAQDIPDPSRARVSPAGSGAGARMPRGARRPWQRLAPALAAPILLALLPACATLGMPTDIPRNPPRAAADAAPVVVSLLGQPLTPPPIAADRLPTLEGQLELARLLQEASPDDEDAIIWHGRRLAYLYRYDDAIAVFTEGLATIPESSKLRRHRGHRYISTRRIDEAIADLSQAAWLAEGVPDALEPDGAPNAAGIPRSTDQSNIYYHLGLAHWLRGDWADALDAYERCLPYSRVNDDMLVATSWWLYLARTRMGLPVHDVLDPIGEQMDVMENDGYHQLLLLAKGERTEDDLLGDDLASVENSTLAGGVANWHLVNGREARAYELYEQIVTGPYWMAFGHITAEAELARRQSG